MELQQRKLGQQFVLKSQKAFDRITYTGYETADSSKWYPFRMNRDRAARKEYFNVELNRLQPGDLFVTQILTDEMKSDDPRLR